jgi:hypothetical protein
LRHAFIDETGSIGHGRLLEIVAAVVANPAELVDAVARVQHRLHLCGRFHAVEEKPAAVMALLQEIAQIPSLEIFVVTVPRRQVPHVPKRRITLYNAAVAQLVAVVWRYHPQTALEIHPLVEDRKLQAALLHMIQMRLAREGLRIWRESVALIEYSPGLAIVDTIKEKRDSGCLWEFLLAWPRRRARRCSTPLRAVTTIPR